MKKIKIFKVVLLVICLTLSMMLITSCNDEKKPDGKGSLDKFSEAIAATNPSEVDGTITMTADFGTMVMEYNAEIDESGSFVLNYSYDKYNDIENGGSSDVTTKVTGTISYADGAYTGDTNVAKIPANVVAAKINVKSDKLDVKVSNDGKVLTATVKAADTKTVFGVAYGSDVTISMTRQNAEVTSLTLTYTYEGASVAVLCNYK